MEEARVIVYGHAACPMVPPVLALLKRSKVDYVYIDIHRDSEARQRVREINNGYESVPTIILPDGSALTEPSINTLSNHLRKAGYSIPLTARLVANLPKILLILFIIWSLLRFIEVL